MGADAGTSDVLSRPGRPSSLAREAVGARTQGKAGRADWPTAENQLELAEAFSLQSEK